MEEVPIATVVDGRFTQGVNFCDRNVQLCLGRSCRFPVTALTSPWDMDGIKTLALAVSMRVGLAQLLRRFLICGMVNGSQPSDDERCRG